LSFPNDSVGDEAGRIFVADSNNRRIQVFDSEGVFIRAFRETDQPEGLTLPRSLALDEQGRLHVADTLNGRVSVFSGEGEYLGSYGHAGSEQERLQYPEGLVVRGATVLVGDRAKARLVAFRLPI
jgi:DNA-binding beta-propeller fold protein YncE